MVSKSTGLDALNFLGDANPKETEEKTKNPTRKKAAQRKKATTNKIASITEVPETTPGKQPKKVGRPSIFPDEWRSDMEPLSGKLPRPVMRQLREIAASEGKSLIALIVEGLDVVFAERDLPTVEQILEREHPNR